MDGGSSKKQSVSNKQLFVIGLVVAVIGYVLFQSGSGGFLPALVAVIGDVIILMSVGRWMYERVRHRG